MQSTIEQKFEQVAGHEFESLFQMIGKDIIGPVQRLDEGLQSIQFPEKFLRCHTAGIPGHRHEIRFALMQPLMP